MDQSESATMAMEWILRPFSMVGSFVEAPENQPNEEAAWEEFQPAIKVWEDWLPSGWVSEQFWRLGHGIPRANSNS
jgi:hypothetical protein